MKKVYLVRDEHFIDGDIFDAIYSDFAEALNAARRDWNHLTDAEKKGREIVILPYDVPENFDEKIDRVGGDATPVARFCTDNLLVSYNDYVLRIKSEGETTHNLALLAGWFERNGNFWNGESYDTEKDFNGRNLYPITEPDEDDPEQFTVTGYELR